MNGILIVIIKLYNGILVMEEISNEIPVAPPSIKWLFNKTLLDQMMQKIYQ
jgi:hypothetical protein